MKDDKIREIRIIRENPRFRRYPEYKESSAEWIGEIPAHWESKRLGHVSTIFKGGTPKRNVDKYFQGDLPWARPVDITALQGALYIHDTEIHISEEALNNSSAKRLPPGTVLLTSRATIGETAITTVPMATNQGFSNFVCNEHLLNIYLLYYLQAIKDLLISLGSGSTYLEVTKGTLIGVSIPLPPLSEQTQIANFLDQKTKQIDELIRIKERQIELLQEQRTALINQAVTKGLDPNVEMKSSGVEWIGEIPAHWKMDKIKYIATFISEKSTPETDAIKISPENVESKTGKVLDFYSSYDAVGVKFQDGDVLFNKIRVYLNKVVFAKYDGYSLGEMIVIRPTLQRMGKYLFYLMLSNRFIEYCDSISYGAKMPRTAVDDILNAKIPIPLDQEKFQIANFLDQKTKQIDELIAIEQRKIELLKEYRQSLISEAVTGKIDVRNEV